MRNTFRTLQVFSGHGAGIECVQWGTVSNSATLRPLSASLDGTVIVWDPNTGQAISRSKPAENVGAVSLSMCLGKLTCVAGFVDGTAKVIDFETSPPREHRVTVSSNHMSCEGVGFVTVRDMILLAACSVEGTVKVFDTLRGIGERLTMTVPGGIQTDQNVEHVETGCTRLTWHPSEPIFVTGGVDRSGLCLWSGLWGGYLNSETNRMEPILQLTGHTETVTDVLLIELPDRIMRVISSSEDGTVKAYEVDLKTLQNPNN